MVCDLEGHHYQPAHQTIPSIDDQRKQGHGRSLFWICYIFDKDISIRYSQPPCLTEDYCDLTLPAGWDNIYDSSPLSNGSFRCESDTAVEFIPCFSEDLHLSQIKEKIGRFLCSPHTPNLSDSQLLCHIRQLDLDLETWRSGIPVDYRPRLSCAAGQPTFQEYISHIKRIRCNRLQLEYHYLTTVIHAAVNRCGATYAEAGKLPDSLHNVYHSSSDLSLEASRTTLKMLKSHERLLEEELFG